VSKEINGSRYMYEGDAIYIDLELELELAMTDSYLENVAELR